MWKILFLVVLFSLVNNSFSQDYFSQSPDDALIFSRLGRILDARAMAMGNANSVLSDNYTATVLNPATLGLSRRITVNTSIGASLFRNDATYLGANTSSSKTETFLNQFGLVFPLVSDSASNNVVLSVGYNQSNNFNNVLKFSGFNNSNSLINNLSSYNSPFTKKLLLSYPYFDPGSGEYIGDRTILNGNLNQDAYIFNEGTLNLWSIGFSYEFAYNVFFGLSVNYIVGSYTSAREFTESDTQDFYDIQTQTVPGNSLTLGFENFYIKDVVSRNYNGVDFRFGVLYKFFNFISLGGSVKTPSIVSVKDEHYFNASSSFASGKIESTDSLVNSNFTVQSPFEFTAAASVNLWIITGSAEITYIDYTQMRFTDGLTVPKRSDLSKQIVDEYSQIFNVRAGAEFRLPFTGLSARAGAIYLPSPRVNDPTEFDRKYLTAGLGIKSGEGSMEFNVAYVLGWWDEASEEYGNGISRVTRSIRADNILGSLILRF